MRTRAPLITPADGGRLITNDPPATVGIANYIRKVNFRRDRNVEARREGWFKFRPNADLPLGVQPLSVPGVTLLAENVRPNSDRCVIAATATTIYRYRYETGTWSTIGSGYSAAGRPWQVVTIDGWIIFNNGVDLPCSYRVEDSAVVPLKELREVGIASITWICEYNGFLIGLNVRVIIPDRLATVLNSAIPYGLVDDAMTNHIPYRLIWSEFGKPTNWAPLFKVTMPAASSTITLPFPSSIFVAGQTRVAVINGGQNGNTLGGDFAHPDGILVTGASGNTITLEISTNSALAYPREVQITRWTDISTMSAYKNLQDDASHIICGKSLNGMLAIYRTRGIMMGRYTAKVAEPFTFGRAIKCESVPLWGESVADVDGEYHLYPAEEGFFAFDGVNPPVPHPVMEACSKSLLTDLPAGARVRAFSNPLTEEVWFTRPGLTIAFDTVSKTTSEIDATIDACAFVSRPGWDEDWFILAIGGTIYTYGRVGGKPLTWLRDSVNPGGRICWGSSSFGDEINDKMLWSYLPSLAEGQAVIPMRLRILGGFTGPAHPEVLLDETFPDLGAEGLIPLAMATTFVQDELHIAGNADVDVRLVGRVIETGVIRTSGLAHNA